jgi:carbamoyltransferase
MNVLGINAFHGDASAALLRDGVLVSALEEERLNRVKHWAGLPLGAAAACLAGERAEHIAISRDPRAHLFEKAVRTLTRPRLWARAASRAANLAGVAGLRAKLAEAGLAHDRTRVHHVEHHRAHLASAFFASPFEEAAVVSVDGFGDYSSVMWGAGRGNRIDVRDSVRFPHSLGIFYTAFTQFLGFPHYGDEYKMMGLAAYGVPRFRDKVRQVVRTAGGQVELNLDYFTHHSQGVDMTWQGGAPALGAVYSRKMVETFGPPRQPRTELLPEHADLAASAQAVLEENYFALLRHVHRETGMRAVCLAGGVALNCAANGKLLAETPFRDIYVQPAANDAGTSIGAALYTWHQTLGKPRSFEMKHVYYGPEYGPGEIEQALRAAGARYERMSEEQLLDSTAHSIAAGEVTGWFQGRMEFGPRALGNRSILADPRRGDMKDILNSRIKLREPFRPFCPSVLAERAGEFFETDYPSPFMVMAYGIRPERRGEAPAVTHADGTGRLQTVTKEASPLYWKLIRRFGELTGVPMLLNTSFNENEPIVNTPAQAIDCFLRTKMDALAIGPFLLRKAENPAAAERGECVETAR